MSLYSNIDLNILFCLPQPRNENTMQENQNYGDDTRDFVVLTSGTVVAQYRIVERIGAGGMGEVYVAEDTRLNRRVALSVAVSPAQRVGVRASAPGNPPGRWGAIGTRFGALHKSPTAWSRSVV